ncbi:SRF-TF-domain-containing protein [Backusella circina FSU 941]|nr:SRF-TF-domain-containing protein [Backusella circina FSU 941]
MQSSNYYPPQQQYMMPSSSIIQESASLDGQDDDSDTAEIPEKRSGRRKIKIEYINDKSRRHITFSKRKAGIMKKAYELSTLTGTQILLLVVSETGLVYTFTTPKLQPLVTEPEGKNLIQSCLNSPDTIESSMTSPPSHQGPSSSRPAMSTNPVATSSSMANTGYYRTRNTLDSNEYNDTKKNFGNMVPNQMTMNSAAGPQQHMTSNYAMPYTNYNNTQSTTENSLYPYNMPGQQQAEDGYWKRQESKR